MSKKQRIEELERRVRDLEARPAYVPVYVPQYMLPPVYVRPYILYAPPQPYWSIHGTAMQVNTSFAAGLPQNAAVGNLIEQH